MDLREVLSRTGLGDGLTFTVSYSHRDQDLAGAIGNTSSTEGTVNTSNDDRMAESIKLTMKALKEYLGLKSGSEKEKLQFIGSEFGRIASRSIATSDTIEGALENVRDFWNRQGLGEMEILTGTPLTFTIRNCFDCIAAQAGETLCGFKEGFINAILRENATAKGTIEEIECCELERLAASSPSIQLA